MSTLSALICTYNRPDMLFQCLRALLQRTEEKPDQVVVVNGGDERADTVALAFANSSRSAFCLIKTINKNLAASRNIGLARCTGDIIAMTDDDAEVLPDWVSELKRLHSAHPEAGAIGGQVLSADPEPILCRVADRVTFRSYPAATTVRTLPGVNVSYKREVIERVGLQDETLFRGEDVDFNWRVLRLGYDVRYEPAVRVIHHHRPTLRGFLQQHYMYGRAYYLVRRKWPGMYCIYPHRLKRPKDFVKLGHFFAAALYEPILVAARLDSPLASARALPIVTLHALSWRAGMIRQAIAEHLPAGSRP